jgi:phosphatidylinositol-3-phosphatase
MADNPHHTGPTGPQNRRERPSERCGKCGAAVVADQRYCLQCGLRRGQPRLDFTAFWKPRPSHAQPLTAGASAPSSAARQRAGGTPSRKVSCLLAGVMLAGGVAAGAAIGPATGSGTGAAFAGVTRSLLAGGAAGLLGAARQAQPAPAPAPSSPAASAAPAPTASSAEALAPALPASGLLRARLLALRAKLRAEREAIEAASTSSPASTEVSPTTGASKGEERPTTSPSTGTAGGGTSRPPITNVWLVALSQGSFSQSLTAPAAYPYLDKTLVPEGTLLSDYRLVAGSELANEIALLSGQGPNPATEANCPTYEAVLPPTSSGSEGLASGTGCVYPASVQSLAGEVTTAGLTWRGYAQDMTSTTAGTADACVHPMLGEAAPTPAPVAGQDYAAFRNPFVFFDSLLENGACVSDDVDLTRLGPDLANPANTPNFSWIAPAACDDGSSLSCASAGPSAGAAPVGAAAVDSFLQQVVTQIMATPAYQRHGLIIITFDSAPAAASQGAAAASNRSANRIAKASAGATSPSATSAAHGPAVGALLLSPFVQRGARVSPAFDDFSILKSLEQLYGVPLLGHAADTGVAQLGSKVYTTGATRSETPDISQK